MTRFVEQVHWTRARKIRRWREHPSSEIIVRDPQCHGLAEQTNNYRMQRATGHELEPRTIGLPRDENTHQFPQHQFPVRCPSFIPARDLHQDGSENSTSIRCQIDASIGPPITGVRGCSAFTVGTVACTVFSAGQL